MDSLKLEKKVYKRDKPEVIEGGEFETITVMDCHNVRIRKCKAKEILLNDSYPSIGLKNIVVEECEIEDTHAQRPLFVCGHNVRGVYLINNKIRRCFGGSHGIYISVGHWEKAIPFDTCEEFVLDGNEVGIIPAGRCGIQFNGMVKKILVQRNTVYCTQINGYNFIGCQDTKVLNNIAYGINRGTCCGVYDYHDPHYWNINSKASMKIWDQCHHANRNILIQGNIFVVGPTAFYTDQYHKDYPEDHHPAIFVTNHTHQCKWPEYHHKTHKVMIAENKIWTPNDMIMQFTTPSEAQGSFVDGNEIDCQGGWPSAVNGKYLWIGKKNVFKQLGYGDKVSYPFVDGEKEPNYDWAKEFKVDVKGGELK